ncbi:putative integral membrane protein [Theileria parva strain Muguga]|uniref:GRAM domain-containing protein n=1 Tax=Theileria parva TaxID=5875 RepID=Q4N808_THEPA|nr:putative integral membrane protein [Theileria parva strain Muguga]EAN33900.1 putative integral membrane protein [Theileria parva strain Muguga]|eukprot:XP_766183.1 hypothetical protein [Theileria parva strain Muguga]
MYHKMFCKLDVDSNLEKIEFEPVISESSKNVIILKNLLKLNKTVLKYSRQNHLSNSRNKIEDSNQYSLNDQINKYDKVIENEDNSENKGSEHKNSLIFSTEVKNNQNYRDLFKYLLIQYKYLVTLSTQSKSFVSKKLNKSRIIQKYRKYQNLLKQLSNYENALQEIIISAINQLNGATQCTIPKFKNYINEEVLNDEIFLNKLKNCSLFKQSLLNNVATNSNPISDTPGDNCVKSGMDNTKYLPLYEYLKGNEIDASTVYMKCNKLSRMTLNEVKTRQKYNNYINLLVKCYKMKNELIESINQFNRDVVNFKAYFFDNVNNVNYDIVDRVNKFHYSKYNIYYFLMSQISDSVPPHQININSINTVNTTNNSSITNTTNTIDSVVDTTNSNTDIVVNTSESNIDSVNSINVDDSDNSDTPNSPIVECNTELNQNGPVEMEERITKRQLTPHFSDLGTTFGDSSPSRCPINTDDTSEDATTNSGDSSGTTKPDNHNEDNVSEGSNKSETTEPPGKENYRIVLRQLNGKLCKKLSKSIINSLSGVNDYSNEYLSYACNMIEFTSKSLEASDSENSDIVDDIKKYIGDNINHILHTISSISPDNTVSSNPQLQTYSRSISTLRSKQFESFDDNILLYINNLYIIALLYGSNYYTSVGSNSSEQGISARRVNRENSIESCDGKMCGEDLSHVIIKSDKYICLHTGGSELIIPNDKMEDYVMSRLKLSGPVVLRVSCVLLGVPQVPGVLYITRDKLGFHSLFQRRFFLSKNNFRTIPFVDITDFSIDSNKLCVYANSPENDSLGVNTKIYTFMILDTNMETILHYINHYKNNSVGGNLRLNNAISAEYLVNYIVNNYNILYNTKTLVYNCNVNMDLFQFYNLVLNHSNKNSFVSMSKEALGFTEGQTSNSSFINPSSIITSIKSNLQKINALDETQDDNEDNVVSVKMRNGDIMKGLCARTNMNYTLKNTNSKFFNKKITTCENLCYVFFNDVTIYQSVTTISNSPFTKFFYTVYTIIATSITPTDYSLDNLNSVISNSSAPRTTNPINKQENSTDLSSENSEELDPESDKQSKDDSGNPRMEINGIQIQLNEDKHQNPNETFNQNVSGNPDQNRNVNPNVNPNVSPNLENNVSPDEDCSNPEKDKQQKDNETSSQANNSQTQRNQDPYESVNRKSELNIKIYADVVFNKKMVFEKMIRNEANTKMAQATEVIAKELDRYKVSHGSQNTTLTNFEVNNQNNRLIFFVLLIIFMFYYYH